jgi:hypothetical protein
MAKYDYNLEALQEAGFTIKTPLPTQYKRVLAGLSRDELACLTEVKRKLDAAQEKTTGQVPPWIVFFVPL